MTPAKALTDKQLASQLVRVSKRKLSVSNRAAVARVIRLLKDEG